MWTNADEVKSFIDAHKELKWLEGDRCVLPDIEQAYEVVAVRAFKRRGKFMLFVDLEAACAVEGCGEYFISTKEVHQWMSSPHLVRCCPAHRFGFSTPMEHAWKTQEQIAGMVPKQGKVKRPKHPRIGPNEEAVLGVIGAMTLVAEAVSVDALTEQAIKRLPLGDPSKRDTRRQSVVRAIKRLAQRGRLEVVSGRVML